MKVYAVIKQSEILNAVDLAGIYSTKEKAEEKAKGTYQISEYYLDDLKKEDL